MAGPQVESETIFQIETACSEKVLHPAKCQLAIVKVSGNALC